MSHISNNCLHLSGGAERTCVDFLAVMAEMVGSALVQEAVSRGVSFVLGKREAAASQGHLMERLEMAANELELALERSAKLVITDVSLLQRRNKLIKPAYIQAMELLERHNRQQQALPAGGQEDQLVSRGQKRKLWMIFRANENVVPVVAPSSVGGLDTAVVQRFERFADLAGKLVRDVESACSLLRNNLCSNPIVRHLFEGRSLSYQLVQGNQRRSVHIWPLRSEQRGLEVALEYSYNDESTPVGGKTFSLMLFLRLSGSTDIVGVAVKGLQYLASHFKLLAAESAVGELTLLPTLLQGIAPSRAPWEVDAIRKFLSTMLAQCCRPDPACCRASRLGLCSSNNNVSSELSHIFPEEVICFKFDCYISTAVEAPNSSRLRGSSFGAGRSISSSMVGWTPPLEVSVTLAPHQRSWVVNDHGDHVVVWAKGVETERRDGSLEHVSKMLKSDAVNCFLRQPELTDYRVCWSASRHGRAWFMVKRPRIQPIRTKYNTRGRSTKASARRLM